MWDVCVKDRGRVKLPIMGETKSGKKATGDVWIELFWDPPPYDLDADPEDDPAAVAAAANTNAAAGDARDAAPPGGAQSSPAARAPTPQGRGRRSNVVLGDITGVEGIDSDDSQYEELRRATTIKAAPPPPVERRAADVKYVPLPPVSDHMVRAPLAKCYCGFEAELTVDLLAHLEVCPDAKKDPMRTIDALLLLRTLDPDVEMKDASARLLSASSAGMIIQMGSAGDRAFQADVPRRGGGRKKSGAGLPRAKRNSGTGLGLPGLLPAGLANGLDVQTPKTGGPDDDGDDDDEADRPATANSDADRPDTASSRPGTAASDASRPDTASSRPGTAASDAGDRPDTASSTGSRKRVSFFGLKRRKSQAAT